MGTPRTRTVYSNNVTTATNIVYDTPDKLGNTYDVPRKPLKLSIAILNEPKRNVVIYLMLLLLLFCSRHSSRKLDKAFHSTRGQTQSPLITVVRWDSKRSVRLGRLAY